ncbi:MAG: ATP-binding protein [Alphaproteobacteria bacterium]
MKEMLGFLIKENNNLEIFIKKSFTDLYKHLRQSNYLVQKKIAPLEAPDFNRISFLEKKLKNLIASYYNLQKYPSTLKSVERVMQITNDVVACKAPSTSFFYSYETPAITTEKVDFRIVWVLAELIAFFYGNSDKVVHIFIQTNQEGLVFKVHGKNSKISKKKLNNIFHAFGENKDLFCCKKIVDHMHWDIWVESEKGQGASFYLAVQKEEKPETL